MAEPLHPDATPWIEMWFRQMMRKFDEAQATLRCLAAREASIRHPGGPSGPRAIRTLEEFEVLLRQVIRWLEKDYAAVPKWRIVNAMYRLSKEPKPERSQKLQTVASSDALDQAAKQWWMRCEQSFEVDLNVLIEEIRRDLYGG